MSGERTDPRRRRISVVLALGESTRPARAALESTIATLSTSDTDELLILDSYTGDELRPLLGECTGNARVLHQFPALGRLDALALGASLATGAIVVFAAAEIALDPALLDALAAPFASDPGLGFVEPTVRYGAIAEGEPRPFVAPVVALRALALRSIGGPAALRTIDPGAGAGARRGPLVPEAVLGQLLASGWRQARVDAEVAHGDGLVEQWTSPHVLAPHQRPDWEPPFYPARTAAGLNVVGLLDAACGIADAARRYVDALERSSVPFATFAYHGHNSPAYPFSHRGDGRFAHDTTLIALNADLLPIFGAHAGRELWGLSRYTIGLWFWELEQLSPQIERGYRLVNEVWAASEFNRAAFARGTDKPVVRIPLPVRRREGRPLRSRRSLGLPEAFTFLTIFDFGSVAERKNSMGVVQAFCDAFAPGEGPVLVLKTLNARWDRAGWSRLQQAIRGRRDVLVLDGYLSDEDVSEMIGAADCYVSLHRAEGFGLTPAEAMAWGRPVIATGYSGNLDFMSETNSYLVPYDLARVPPRLSHIYPTGASWAEPRLADAAALMRRVYSAREEAEARGEQGQRDIRRSHSVEVAAQAIAGRLEQIDRLRGRGAGRTRRAREGAQRLTGRH